MHNKIKINLALLIISIVFIIVDKLFFFAHIRVPTVAKIQQIVLRISHLVNDYQVLVKNTYGSSKHLREENAKLKANLEKLSINLKIAQNLYDDESKIHTLLTNSKQYQYRNPVLAQYLLSPDFINKEQIMFTVYKPDNIQVSSPVINSIGLIGQVLTTKDNYVTVHFLSTPNFKIYVQNDNGSKLLLQGNGNDSMIGNYANINNDITVGNVLYTTGLDNNYPKHTPVAIVNNIKKNGNVFTVDCNTIVKKDQIDFAVILIK